MYNYYQILRLAHKRDIKLQKTTLRKDFCVLKIKPEKFICRIAHFSEEAVNTYLDNKIKSLSRVGRPKSLK